MTYLTTQQLERGGVACMMIEDTSVPRVSTGAALAPIPVMVGRIKAALDARRDQTMMMMARIIGQRTGTRNKNDGPGGAAGNCWLHAFYLTGFSLDQQQKAKAILDMAY